MTFVRRLCGVTALAAVLAAPAFAGGSGLPVLKALIPVQQLTAGKQGSARLSANWAGFAVTSPDPVGSPLAYTHVIGTWKVPAITCDAGDASSQSAFWVGLGGFNGDQHVEQVGTWADCDTGGPPSYFGWYELAPSLASSFALKVEAGDTMSATVDVTTTNQVTLTLKNVTRHKQAVMRARPAVVDLSSAEWMAEAPSACTGACSVLPMANFGSFGMSNLGATANGQFGTLTNPSWSAFPIEIGSHVSSPGTCTPTGTSATGTSFTLSWAAAATANC